MNGIYSYLLGWALLVEDCVDEFQSAYAQSYKCIFCRYHRLRCDEQEDDLHFDRVMYIFLVAPEKYNQNRNSTLHTFCNKILYHIYNSFYQPLPHSYLFRKYLNCSSFLMKPTCNTNVLSYFRRNLASDVTRSLVSFMDDKFKSRFGKNRKKIWLLDKSSSSKL